MCAHCFSAYDEAKRGTSADSKSFPKHANAPSVHEIFATPTLVGSRLTPSVRREFFKRCFSILSLDSTNPFVSSTIISALRFTRARVTAGSSGGARARSRVRRLSSPRRRVSASVGTKPCLKSAAVALCVLRLWLAVPACGAQRLEYLDSLLGRRVTQPGVHAPRAFVGERSPCIAALRAASTKPRRSPPRRPAPAPGTSARRRRRPARRTPASSIEARSLATICVTLVFGVGFFSDPCPGLRTATGSGSPPFSRAPTRAPGAT